MRLSRRSLAPAMDALQPLPAPDALDDTPAQPLRAARSTYWRRTSSGAGSGAGSARGSPANPGITNTTRSRAIAIRVAEFELALPKKEKILPTDETIPAIGIGAAKRSK